MTPDDATRSDSFTTTRWTLLFVARDPNNPEYLNTLNTLIESYWRPVYHYVLRRGHDREKAKDLVQSFFATWIEKGTFGMADPKRGKFRAFLLTCLKHFLYSTARTEHAQIRRPPGGVVSIETLIAQAGDRFQPTAGVSPEDDFDRTWFSDLLSRVMAALEAEYRAKGKRDHYELFRRRIFEPFLFGGPQPDLTALAREFGLGMKEASNRIIAARRAYQRLLRAEIRTYAQSEDEVEAEVRDLFRSFSGR